MLKHPLPLNNMDDSLTDKRLIAQVVHDMRSPLAVVKGYINNISPEDPDLIEFQQAALRSITKLQCLVEMLSAPTASISPQRQWINVAELIHLTVRELRTLTKNKDIEIVHIGAASLFAFVDPFLINRVLVNLIINSLQAINGGVGTIRVGLFLNCDAILIEVSDNGSGIEPEHLDRVFEPGFTTGKKDGTGHGLDICRQIAEAHDGKIEVYSIVNCGTVFTTSLPYSTDSIYIPEEHGTRWQEATLD